jgi:hypothetical protein
LCGGKGEKICKVKTTRLAGGFCIAGTARIIAFSRMVVSLESVPLDDVFGFGHIVAQLFHLNLQWR